MWYTIYSDISRDWMNILPQYIHITSVEAPLYFLACHMPIFSLLALLNMPKYFHQPPFTIHSYRKSYTTAPGTHKHFTRFVLLLWSAEWCMHVVALMGYVLQPWQMLKVRYDLTKGMEISKMSPQNLTFDEIRWNCKSLYFSTCNI